MKDYPERGDYGTTPGHGLAMAFVRAGTGRPRFLRPAWAGHAVIVLETSSNGDVRISEATPDHGVVERWITPDGGRWHWSNEALTTEQRDAIVTTAHRYIGVPYDWPSIIAFVVRSVVKDWRGHAQDHPDAKLFCSEWVAWLYRDFAHLDLFPGVAPGTVSPADLDRRITS